MNKDRLKEREAMTRGIRKKHNTGRVEYRAVQAEVEEQLTEGYSMNFVYRSLANTGRLSMSYASFCDYVRGGGMRTQRRKTGPKEQEREASILLSDIMESISVRADFGCNFKLIYQKLVERGMDGYSYSEFCQYFRAAGAYLGRDIPDDYIFFDQDNRVVFYYRLESFLNEELDRSTREQLHQGDSGV